MSGQPNIMSAFGARRTTQAASDSPATQTAARATSSPAAAAMAGRGQATSSTAAPAEASGFEFTQAPGWIGVTEEELSKR